MKKLAKVLVIAGSDSCAGAGMQADLKAITLNNAYASTIVTCLTAQNTQKVIEVFETPLNFLKLQLQAVLSDIEFSVIKIGMLSSTEIIDTIANELNNIAYNFKLLVDPVMVATSGDILLKKNAIESLKLKLISKAFLVTPNIDEAEILANKTIKNLFDMKESAFQIKALGAKAVLIKGGHLEFDDLKIHSVLLDENNQFTIISNDKVNVKQIHGTGCSLASAISANLANGFSLIEACQKANNFVYQSALNYQIIGKGSAVLGF
ncbi:MAG: Hydroxymethylpyrimidine/phosphomethylpyrimidine kinase [Pseudomonadota bacterium]|jgi:hydroxymethylpyrimidine/phosphomethylpyrimidine kinase